MFKFFLHLLESQPFSSRFLRHKSPPGHWKKIKFLPKQTAMNRRKSIGLEAISLQSELVSTPKGFRTRTIVQKPAGMRMRQKRVRRVVERSQQSQDHQDVSQVPPQDDQNDPSWQDIPENDNGLDSFEPDDVVFIHHTKVCCANDTPSMVRLLIPS